MPESDAENQPFRLQISSKHAVGGAGGLLSDEARYPSVAALLNALRDLEVSVEAVSAARSALEQEDAERRWQPVATGVQIPFAVMTAAGFNLEDEGV